MDKKLIVVDESWRLDSNPLVQAHRRSVAMRWQRYCASIRLKPELYWAYRHSTQTLPRGQRFNKLRSKNIDDQYDNICAEVRSAMTSVSQPVKGVIDEQ